MVFRKFAGWGPDCSLVLGGPLKIAAILTLALLAGCSVMAPFIPPSLPPVPDAPSSPARLSLPAAGVSANGPVSEAVLLKPGAELTLSQVVDAALQNNPLTRESYLRTLAAAAAAGSQSSSFYPSVNLSSGPEWVHKGPNGATETSVGGIGFAISLSYLVWDLGGRRAEAQSACLALSSADWAHNATLHDVALGAEMAFVQYINAKAREEASVANLREAQKALEAATKRRDTGVATIADVLQATTALSQARLDQETVKGEVLIRRGELAYAMGVLADTPIEVGVLPSEMPIDEASQAVEAFIERAKMDRPDLAAARLLAEKALTDVVSVRSRGRPTVSLTAQGGESILDPGGWSDSGTVGLTLSAPLFTGFKSTRDIQKAKVEADLAQCQVDALERDIILEVWTSYYALKTAAQLVKTSRDVLNSAEESERVALGRYQQGVGTLVDLLIAQSTLAKARSQEISSRSSWFLALSQLAHDAGLAAPVEGHLKFSESERSS